MGEHAFKLYFMTYAGHLAETEQLAVLTVHTKEEDGRVGGLSLELLLSSVQRLGWHGGGREGCI